MNRNINKIDKLNEIAKVIQSINTEKEAISFLKELLTNAEAETLSKRWRILEMLIEGYTQRGIAQELQVSLCKVTRGSKLLKNKNSILAKHLTKD